MRRSIALLAAACLLPLAAPAKAQITTGAILSAAGHSGMDGRARVMVQVKDGAWRSIR